MLAIGKRNEAVRLSHLEQLAIAARACRGALETCHAGHGQETRASLAPRHPHQPVRRHEFVSASRAGLMAECREDDAVVHQHPLRRGDMIGVILGFRLLAAGGRRCAE